MEQIGDVVAAHVADLRAIPDHVARINAIRVAIEDFGTYIGDLAAARREAVQQMQDSGLSLAEIGRELDVTKARVAAILAGKRPAAD